MRRPNEYREWLIGQEIPALFAKVYGGAKLPVTIKGTKSKGKRGMEFVRVVLRELGENDQGRDNQGLNLQSED